MVRAQIKETKDATHNNLVLALLDQWVAGKFHNRTYAYTAVCLDEGGYGLGVAELDQPGYTPIPSDVVKFSTYDQAQDAADGMNLHIGLTGRDAVTVVMSSMRAWRG